MPFYKITVASITWGNGDFFFWKFLYTFVLIYYYLMFL